MTQLWLPTFWRPMRDAPRDCTWIEVVDRNDYIHVVHWAQDLSGEDQPPFSGWFRRNDCDTGFSQVDNIVDWRPINGMPHL